MEAILNIKNKTYTYTILVEGWPDKVKVKSNSVSIKLDTLLQFAKENDMTGGFRFLHEDIISVSMEENWVDTYHGKGYQNYGLIYNKHGSTTEELEMLAESNWNKSIRS